MPVHRRDRRPVTAIASVTAAAAACAGTGAGAASLGSWH